MFYRSLLAAIAAVVIASPVFADDTTASTDTSAAATTTQSTDAAATTTADASTAEKININTATAKDLMKIKGINASKARAIVVYRKKNGEFKSVDDLANVKGFKKLKAKQLKAITDQLTM